jgi:hypothetical protein
VVIGWENDDRGGSERKTVQPRWPRPAIAAAESFVSVQQTVFVDTNVITWAIVAPTFWNMRSMSRIFPLGLSVPAASDDRAML